MASGEPGLARVYLELDSVRSPGGAEPVVAAEPRAERADAAAAGGDATAASAARHVGRELGRFMGLILDGICIQVSAGYPVDVESLLKLVSSAIVLQ